MQLIERAARALCAEALSKRLMPAEDKERAINELWPSYTGMAGVVLEAARDPSQPEPLLPCDVKLPPATTIKAGVPVSTLMLALTMEGRPRHFEDRGAIETAERLARRMGGVFILKDQPA